MKTCTYYIFKCRYCGKTFFEDIPLSDFGGKKAETFAEQLGQKRGSLRATHHCEKYIYGCADLIGCKI